MNEHEIQAAFIRWLNQVAVLRWVDQLMMDGKFCAFAPPNMGRRNYQTASYMKAEGMRSGVPDIVIPDCAGIRPDLYLEFKTARGSLSKSQRVWKEALSRGGDRYRVVRSVEDAVAAVERWLG